MKRHAAHHPDAEMAQLQQRIRLDRIALTLSVRATQQAIRERLSSPGMLLAAAGTGFVLGRVAKRKSGTASARGRGWGLLTEAAKAAFKLASSGPAVWLTTVLRAPRAQRSPPQDLRSAPQ